MLLSNAIALAQEGCCFDFDSQSPISSSQEGEEIPKHQWNQLLCVFIHLADENLATRLGLNPLLAQGSSDVVQHRFSATFGSILPDSALWESYFELSRETRKARMLLQSLKKGNQMTGNVDILAELEYIDRALSRWKRHHTYSDDSTVPAL
jgi:hypothetical protein